MTNKEIKLIYDKIVVLFSGTEKMSQKSSETKRQLIKLQSNLCACTKLYLEGTFRRMCHLLPFHITNNELRSFILINALYKWKVTIN